MSRKTVSLFKTGGVCLGKEDATKILFEEVGRSLNHGKVFLSPTDLVFKSSVLFLFSLLGGSWYETGQSKLSMIERGLKKKRRNKSTENMFFFHLTVVRFFSGISDHLSASNTLHYYQLHWKTMKYPFSIHHLFLIFLIHSSLHFSLFSFIIFNIWCFSLSLLSS